MKIPKPISRLIDNFERLPGIGPKTAQRLTFYLLHFPQEELEKFASSLSELKGGTKICSICKNVDEHDPCSVCSSDTRDNNLIAVVANPLDVFALERAGYKGKYHVLHGVIDPLNNVGPDEIFMYELIDRVGDIVKGETTSAADWEDYITPDDEDEASEPADKKDEKLELILATNTSMEGESTAMYIVKLLKDSGITQNEIKITRLARGLPVGSDIEYADDTTLSRALEGRSNF